MEPLHYSVGVTMSNDVKRIFLNTQENRLIDMLQEVWEKKAQLIEEEIDEEE